LTYYFVTDDAYFLIGRFVQHSGLVSVAVHGLRLTIRICRKAVVVSLILHRINTVLVPPHCTN